MVALRLGTAAELALAGVLRGVHLTPLVEPEGVRSAHPLSQPWLLLHDTALGARSAACNTDLLLGIHALRFAGAGGTNTLELHLGKINPNYPRNPDVPVF